MAIWFQAGILDHRHKRSEEQEKYEEHSKQEELGKHNVNKARRASQG
jgi:hypothetical protein